MEVKVGDEFHCGGGSSLWNLQRDCKWNVAKRRIFILRKAVAGSPEKFKGARSIEGSLSMSSESDVRHQFVLVSVFFYRMFFDARSQFCTGASIQFFGLDTIYWILLHWHEL
jgi:hypothetical protein